MENSHNSWYIGLEFHVMAVTMSLWRVVTVK